MSDQIRRQPVIRLKEEEIEIKNKLTALIKSFYHKKPGPNKAEILRHLVMGLISMISEVYKEMGNSKTLAKSRTHQIIDDFYQLILKYGIYTHRFTYLTDSQSNNFDSLFALGLGHTYHRLPPILEFYLIKH